MDRRALKLRLLKRVFFAPEVTTGRDSINRLDCLDSGTRVLLLVSASAAQRGTLDKVTAQLKWATACEVIAVDGGEPKASAITALRERVNAAAPEWIIGVGGGSVLDTAKFIWAQYEHPELQWGGPAVAIPPLRAKARLILAPTTSGSGSESSQAAVLSGESGAKIAYVSPHWMPDLVVLDPLLTTGMPAALTASTGFDALTHAVEAAVSGISHPMLRVLSGSVVRSIRRHLPVAVRAPEDLAAREGMQNAAFLGGLCQSTASTGAAHALSHATTALYGPAHGLATGFYLVPTMRMNLAKKPAVYDELAAESGMQGGAELISAIEGLAREVGIPEKLSGLVGRELEAAEQKGIAEAAMKDVCMRTNACQVAAADVEQVLGCL